MKTVQKQSWRQVDSIDLNRYQETGTIAAAVVTNSGSIYKIVGPIDMHGFFYLKKVGPNTANLDKALEDLKSEKAGLKDWQEVRFVRSFLNLRNIGVIEAGERLTYVGRTGDKDNGRSTPIEQIYVIV